MVEPYIAITIICHGISEVVKMQRWYVMNIFR